MMCDYFYGFDAEDEMNRREEEAYFAELEYIEWCRKVEDEAYELLLPVYFSELDASMEDIV